MSDEVRDVLSAVGRGDLLDTVDALQRENAALREALERIIAPGVCRECMSVEIAHAALSRKGRAGGRPKGHISYAELWRSRYKY